MWIPKLGPWPYRSEFSEFHPRKKFLQNSPVTLMELTHRPGQGTRAFWHRATRPYRHTATPPRCHAATPPCQVTGAQGLEPQSYRQTILLDLTCPWSSVTCMQPTGGPRGLGDPPDTNVHAPLAEGTPPQRWSSLCAQGYLLNENEAL
ncbi:hypothetical protein HJG60_007779 [Phyllostomus discolor]|uniref:Uncharacterized protein n=1 Tax=Phyllostomus discolor TaxID=89673 RepID=A0A834BN66_9CHIR|nr:hypothetical protein HJG60_007779 [Phyllostomus discolor]